jgi:hypothetical protein
MWTISLDILEIFVILQLKQQGDVLEQDIELCLLAISCNYCWKGRQKLSL